MDIAHRLSNIVNNPVYSGSLTANTKEAFDTIVWLDSRPKPTWNQILNEKDPVMPDIKNFLIAISHNSHYKTWVNQLTNSEALSLALTLDRGNLVEFQLAYNNAKNRVNPDPLGVAEWQALANQNDVKVTF
jgi:hypothetical protein